MWPTWSLSLQRRAPRPVVGFADDGVADGARLGRAGRRSTAMHSNMWLAPATQANVATCAVAVTSSIRLGALGSRAAVAVVSRAVARRALEVLAQQKKADSTSILDGRTRRGDRWHPRTHRWYVSSAASRRAVGQPSLQPPAASRSHCPPHAANIDRFRLHTSPHSVEVTQVGSASTCAGTTIAQVVGADALVMTAAVCQISAHRFAPRPRK